MNIKSIQPAFKGTIVIPNIDKLTERQQECISDLKGSGTSNTTEVKKYNKDFEQDMLNMCLLEKAGIKHYTYARNANTIPQMRRVQHQEV